MVVESRMGKSKKQSEPRVSNKLANSSRICGPPIEYSVGAPVVDISGTTGNVGSNSSCVYAPVVGDKVLRCSLQLAGSWECKIFACNSSRPFSRCQRRLNGLDRVLRA